MKKGILLYAHGSSSWIGGLYYIKNVVYQLIANETISAEYKIYVSTTKENRKIFSVFGDSIKILNGGGNKLVKLLKIIWYKLRYKIKFVFPMYTDLNFLKIRTISWIPDFQHNYLPELFSEDDVKLRTEIYQETARSNVPLILSSNACLNDYKKFYNPIPSKPIAVVPFVSYIKPELEQLHADSESRILEKFGLTDKRYVCISNQFWKHKNHLLVFKALNILMESCENFSTVFVFTGKMEDIRHPKYIDELKEYSEKLNRICKVVGFVDRNEQLVLMKNAEFIIQPSLFEGWGTVVEDAKVLDKTVLLSNIPVHVEQKNDKCILFDPHDAHKLAELISEQLNVRHSDSVREGISDMERRAVEYSKGFEKILFYENTES